MLIHLSTYPQGEVSIVPQILSLMAILSTLLAFPVFDRDDNDFMCIKVKSNGFESSDCFPLYLNTEAFWDDERSEGWAGAIRTAALFGIVAGVLGFVSFSLLLTATCFPLKPRKVLSIVIMLAVSAFCAIFTLIAGAADACKFVGSTSCNKESVHVAQGASAMIFAFFLYIAACVMTTLYFIQTRRNYLNDSDSNHATAEETRNLAAAPAPAPTWETVAKDTAPAADNVEEAV